MTNSPLVPDSDTWVATVATSLGMGGRGSSAVKNGAQKTNVATKLNQKKAFRLK